MPSSILPVMGSTIGSGNWKKFTALLALALARQVVAADLEVKEMPLGSPRKVMAASLVVSPDGRRLAGVAPEGKALKLMVDGQAQSGDFEGAAANGIVFSPDSKRLAAMLQSNKKWVVVVDGQTSEAYTTFAKGSLAFSPDSAHWIITADQAGKRVLLLDGKPSHPFDDIARPHFSADGKHVAYVARLANQFFAVVDSAQSPPVERILDDSVVFSPDSNQVAYIGRVSGAWSGYSAAIDPSALKPSPIGTGGFDAIATGTLGFSADGKRVAFAGGRGPAWVLVDNGAESHAYDRILGQSVHFSPSGKSLCFIGERNGGKMLIVRDGAEGPMFDSIDTPTFGPGDHLAYIAHSGKESSLIVDGKPIGPFDDIPARPVFNIDGSRLAFVTVKDKHATVITDGKPGPTFDLMLQGPTFSPDGKRLAYAGRRGRQQFAVIDDKESEGQVGVGRISFSPDSAHVAMAVQTGAELRLMLDSALSTDFVGILHGAALVFDSPTSFNTVVYRSSQLIAVHAALK